MLNLQTKNVTIKSIIIPKGNNYMYICKQGGDGTPKVKIHVEHIFNFGQNNMKYDGCGIGMKFAELV